MYLRNARIVLNFKKYINISNKVKETDYMISRYRKAVMIEAVS